MNLNTLKAYVWDRVNTVAPIGTTVATAFRGSIAHGTYLGSDDPTAIDDIDIISAVVPDVDYYLGMGAFGSKGTVESFKDKVDAVSYELRKLVGMLANCNPNVLNFLWTDPEFYIYRHPAWDALVENRELFLSKKAGKAFAGYATGQLHRMTHFNPNPSTGYLGAKRKGLVDKFGYDCKNASHLIRLLVMGIEVLKSEGLKPNRTGIDATLYIDIKTGKWPLDQVQSLSEDLFKIFKEAESKTNLPDEPDYGKINQLCVKTIKEVLSLKQY